MGTFTASLRAIGDVKSLPAVVELSDGSLKIVAGVTEIGSWSLDEIHLEEIPTGYRLAVEGDQILLEFRDVNAFAAELNNRSKRRLRRARKKDDAVKSPEPAAADPMPPTVKPSEQTGPSVKLTLPPTPESTTKSAGSTSRVLAFVDGTLAKASKRFGPYLPDWMFTRAMFAVAFGALVFMVVLPGLVSTFLLITGALMIVFGAVVYSDAMLASRWLPGRTTPQHALLFGVAILMMGVLLGMIAN